MQGGNVVSDVCSFVNSKSCGWILKKFSAHDKMWSGSDSQRRTRHIWSRSAECISMEQHQKKLIYSYTVEYLISLSTPQISRHFRFCCIQTAGENDKMQIYHAIKNWPMAIHPTLHFVLSWNILGKWLLGWYVGRTVYLWQLLGQK